MSTEQTSLFESQRQTMFAGIEETTISLKAYGEKYEHWAIAYSGGKDSSCVATLIPQLIETNKIPRPKTLTILYADTRMELPPLQNAAMGVMERLKEMGCDCRIVYPEMHKRFFCYMFGRGVPPPSNTFRWCTAQIKINPMMQALSDLRQQYGKKFLMLTGVRVGESAVRDARIAMSCGVNGAECGQGWFQEATPESVADTLAPILHWRVCHVWKWLRQWAPIGGFPTERVADSYGGTEAEEINCRTGCVGCNLASRDTALETLLKDEYWEYLNPLLKLRSLYAELKKPHNRLRKRTAEYTKDGKLVKNPNRMGPLTMKARLMGMNSVIAIQEEINKNRPDDTPLYELINTEEKQCIEQMIAANTWPNGWSGTEGRGDEYFEIINKDRTTQEQFDFIEESAVPCNTAKALCMSALNN